MDNIDQLLEHNYEQLDLLKRELTKLSEIKNRIDELIGSNDKLPVLFSESLLKVIETSKEYSTLIDNSVNLYLKVNNELITNSISEFSKKIIGLESEINRLIAVDFNALFKEIETNFFDNSNKEFEKIIEKIEAKIKNFQYKIDDLGKEITRLSKIDLEEHLNKHQNKLSEIFIAINGINTIIANISQNINTLIQKFGEFEQTLSKNQTEINSNFVSLNDKNESIKNSILEKIEKTEKITDSIVAQNEVLMKEIQFIKKVLFAVCFLVVVSVVLNKFWN
jgi:hypothetical protein